MHHKSSTQLWSNAHQLAEIIPRAAFHCRGVPTHKNPFPIQENNYENSFGSRQVKANGHCPDLARPSSMVCDDTNHQCDPLELLGPWDHLWELPWGQAGGRFHLFTAWRWEVGEGAEVAQLHHLPSLYEQSCTQAAAPPDQNTQSWERPDQPPPESGCAWALQIPNLANGGLPFPSAFCIFQRKEQVISILSLGVFSAAFWALGPPGNQLLHVPFLFHYAKQDFN